MACPRITCSASRIIASFSKLRLTRSALSDKAVETLKDEKLNNCLVSELLAYPDFVMFTQTVKIYIDCKVVSQIAGMNAMYQAAQDTIQERFDEGRQRGYYRLLAGGHD